MHDRTLYGCPRCSNVESTKVGCIETCDEEEDDSGVVATSYASAPSLPYFSFPDSVTAACRGLGYRVIKADKTRVVFEANTEKGKGVIYCYPHKRTLVFTALSRFAFSEKLQIPIALAVEALSQNARTGGQHWCIRKADGTFTLAYMDNLFSLKFDSEWLAIITKNLIGGCRRLENTFQSFT
jgi:hypothetical protein